jgi:hypothetical protein
MKLIVKDGQTDECTPKDSRRISAGAIEVYPVRVPKGMEKVWDNPPTYTELIYASCHTIAPGCHVMTSSGLKEVVKVEY